MFILATCRKPELLRATALIFDTIRVGFPTADIRVQWNGVGPLEALEATNRAATSVAAYFATWPETTHHEWVARLIREEQEPFFCCDTDMVFFSNFERFDFTDVILAGQRSPQFRCKFAAAITKPRLHTCLLRIDPEKVREAVKKFGEQFPDVYCLPRPTLEDLVFPRYIPQLSDRPHFYDTTSLLYQAVGGHCFSDEQMDAFSHLGSATLSDVVASHYPEYRMRETHFAIFENPQLAKGSWKLQDEFYAKHAC